MSEKWVLKRVVNGFSKTGKHPVPSLSLSTKMATINKLCISWESPSSYLLTIDNSAVERTVSHIYICPSLFSIRIGKNIQNINQNITRFPT